MFASLRALLARPAAQPNETACAGCPDPVYLPGPHVTITYQIETQPQPGRHHVQYGTVLGTFHRSCAQRAQVTVRRGGRDHTVGAATDPDAVDENPERSATVPAHRLAAAQAVLRDREAELMQLRGPCREIRCRLHRGHSGPCDIATPARATAGEARRG